MGFSTIGGSASSTVGGYDAGTEASRPASTTAGTARYNTTRNRVEIYNSTLGWQSLTAGSALPTQTITYLIVGGGGGKGTTSTGYGGGGGGGGVLASTTGLTQGVVYTITVGAASASVGTNGGNSSIVGANPTLSLIAYGGGAGGNGWNGSNATGGSSGGSGGGAGGHNGNYSYALSGGSGTAGQGNNGGTSNAYLGPSSGGGGAGSTGGNGGQTTDSNTGGNGGQGVSNSITGTATYYAGGGGGYGVWGVTGSTNTGTIGTGQFAIGNAASNGVVIISYPDSVGTSSSFNWNLYSIFARFKQTIYIYWQWNDWILMKRYAQIYKDRVHNIIVAENLEIAEQTTPEEMLVIELEDNQPVSIGWVWENNIFKNNNPDIQPAPSWTLNENLMWVAPVPIPDENLPYLWNEETLSWYLPEQPEGN